MNTEKKSDNIINKKNADKKKSDNKVYKIVIIILLLIIAVLVYLLITTKSTVKEVLTEKEQISTEKQKLQLELSTLIYKHDSIKISYGKLTDKLSEKDSVILANAHEIQKLIASQADYRRIKRKINRLRDITQRYVGQIDSLYTVNKVLKTENVKIKSAYKKEQKKTSKLAEDTAYLSEKVATASILKAYNVSAASIRLRGGKKEIFTDKAKKIEQIKICFTLGENLIIPNGKKTVYIRVARPDNKILVKGNEDIYSFTDSNGKKLQYSMKKEVDYQNKSIYMCMYWIKKSTKESAMIGRYNVTVFADGYEIGQTYFELK
jgi:cell division protein FtsB